MKRRKAIGVLLVAGGGIAVAAGGVEWYSLERKPDLEYLLGKKDLLTDIAETIIPATDTPGAREAGVVNFLIPILTECTPRKTLNQFIRGLEDLESHTRSAFNKEFSACNAQQRESALEYFENKESRRTGLLAKVKRHFLGDTFIVTLKQYVVESYCISEKGATLGLSYLPVPGKFLPCMPIEPNQKAWATK